MTNLKKVGLSALAGSLVAFSAQAGELAVSGGAKLSYTADTGAQDTENDGNRFGMQRLVSFTGSGEMDNGWNVSLAHNLAMADSPTASTSTLAIDMGSMGTLTYGQGSFNMGIAKYDDVMPTADEEVSNGISTDNEESGTAYEVNGGGNGFNYNYSSGMFTVDLGVSPGGTDAEQDDGANGGSDGAGSDTSIAVKVAPMDGLTLYAGTGNQISGNNSDDHDTYAITYAFGPITAGYQKSEIDFEAAATEDAERTQFGVAFAVNDNLSISYGEITVDFDGTKLDEEMEGISVGYSMGGMTIKAHNNEGKNMDGTADNTSEHTEIAVSFAF